MHYHGTPITPTEVILELAGRNFCVSFARPDQVRLCHQIGQSVMLDNGAFSVWRQGVEIDWAAWREWVEPWLEHKTTWCVLPDSIEGDEAENDRLLLEHRAVAGVPVWHLHESLGRLERLVADYGMICFGSSGAYATVGTEAWHRRVTDAFDRIADPDGRVPWTHMLRGMSLAGGPYPFASLDSTDVARNHNRPQNSGLSLAGRWDAAQCPPRWHPAPQLSLTEEVAS